MSTDNPRLTVGAAMAAQWTYDPDAEAYYFAPMQAAAPPYLKQRHVEAIIDIAADGTLAGVELIDNMPPPPVLATPPAQPAPAATHGKPDGAVREALLSAQAALSDGAFTGPLINDANNAGTGAPCEFCGTYPNPNDPPCATLEQAYARTEVRPFGCPYFTDSDRKIYPLSTPNAPVEPTTAQVEWLEDAARYFEARPTLGEDMAHWANVHNAEMCRKIAAILAVRLNEAAGGKQP